MAKKQEVVPVVQNQGAMAFLSDDSNVPEWARGGTGRGSENVTTKDILLPRLEIIQAQSPIKDAKPDEAKEGLLFNTVTTDILGDTVYVVPIFYRMEWLVWKDQDSGGGFFGAFNTQAEAERRLEEVAAEGEQRSLLEIVDTPVHYCLRIRDDGATEQIVISMSKSKAKVSRKWNSVIQMVGGDRFSRAYRVSTFKDKNRQNKTFYNYIVQPAGFPPEPIYREGERLYQLFKTEGVRANHESFVDNEGEGSGGEGDAPQI